MAQLKARIKSYEEADKYLGSKKSRPIARNTRLERLPSGEIAVLFHDTTILRYAPTGTYATLSSGGWRTFTTKERLNDFLPFGWHIWQEKGQWFMNKYPDRNIVYIFAEGIEVFADGFVSHAGVDKTAENKIMIKRIKKYVTAYMDALLHGKIGAPGPGDCWGCYFVSDDGKENPLGTDHLVRHLDESYFVPSLLVRAINVYPVSMMARYSIQEAWAKHEIVHGLEKEILVEQAGKSLTRYLKSRILGLGV